MTMDDPRWEPGMPALDRQPVRTPVLPPRELKSMGFAMVAYPTTVIFRVARTIERALSDIRAGRPASNDGVNFAEFKDITNYDEWARIEDTYAPGRAAS